VIGYWGLLGFRGMKTVVITGAAGFLGSHLAHHYIHNKWRVIGIDNLSTGRKKNVDDLLCNPHFVFITHDITKPFVKKLSAKRIDLICNFACPASPPQYKRLGRETLLVSSRGVINCIDVTRQHSARLVHASTSEVYGDPSIHPQPETYFGNVNSYGERSMYDEGKRFAEALIWTAQHPPDGSKPLNAGILRIFNTYGPHMAPDDGRVVTQFIKQTIAEKPLTIEGDGSQTRSFCYVDDLIDGIIRLAKSNEQSPINIGNPDEYSIKELAQIILKLTGSSSTVIHLPRTADDPTQRCPDITKAHTLLNWKPTISLKEGLQKTIAYFTKSENIK